MEQVENAEKQYLFSNQDLKKLIVPLLIEQFLAIFVGLADSIMVASIGETAVSAVSLIDTVMITCGWRLLPCGYSASDSVM